MKRDNFAGESSDKRIGIKGVLLDVVDTASLVEGARCRVMDYIDNQRKSINEI